MARTPRLGRGGRRFESGRSDMDSTRKEDVSQEKALALEPGQKGRRLTKILRFYQDSVQGPLLFFMIVVSFSVLVIFSSNTSGPSLSFLWLCSIPIIVFVVFSAVAALVLKRVVRLRFRAGKNDKPICTCRYSGNFRVWLCGD